MLVSHMAAYIFIAIAASGLAANLIKRIIGRARPSLYEDWTSHGFHPFSGARFESFPSGHATTVGALLMALALLAPRFRLMFLVMALWIGFSRVIVAAHYPSDVIAGLTFGAWFSDRVFPLRSALPAGTRRLAGPAQAYPADAARLGEYSPAAPRSTIETLSSVKGEHMDRKMPGAGKAPGFFG
jgi:membrane-associated phospholipid phosphatase